MIVSLEVPLKWIKLEIMKLKTFIYQSTSNFHLFHLIDWLQYLSANIGFPNI